MANAHGYLIFACDSRLYGVPADTAAEVLNVASVVQVPGAPGHVLGVFVHRDELLPLVDLKCLMGAPPSDRNADLTHTRAVLIRSPHGPVALTADRVLGIVSLEGAFQPLGPDGISAHLRGPAQGPGGEVLIIDTQSFVRFLSVPRVAA